MCYDFHILIGLLLFYLSRVFSGFEDGLVSTTEIALARCRKGDKPALKSDTRRRNKWHFWGGMKYITYAFSIGVLLYGFSLNTFLIVLNILSSQVVIFNPIIAKVYLQKSWIYVSEKELLGIPRKSPALYYIINLLIFGLTFYKLLCIG